MGRIEKTVFISYRRTNFWTALAVFQNLHSNGYDVFFDYKSIPSGDFEQVITENVKSRAHFIVILSPSALERCHEPGDWLRREIETAIENKSNIIPLMMEGFDFGSTSTVKALTGKLADLKKYNAIGIPAEYFDDAMIKLRSEKFLNRPLESISHPISNITKRITEEQKSAASEAAPVEKEQLTAQEWSERGYIFWEANNLDEAIRCYAEAIALNPKFAEVYFYRGIARIYNDDLDGAIKDYDKAIQLEPINPENAIFYFFRGNAHHTIGNLDMAISDYDEAIRLKPDDAEPYNYRGVARSDNNDLQGALVDYDEAIRLKLDYVEAYYNRGTAHQYNDDLENAAYDYQEVLRFNPDYESTRTSLINVLRKLGRKKEADEHELLARQVIEKESEYAQACFEAICGNTIKALELLKIGLEKKQATKEWARQDPDFENIRDDPYFKELVGE